MTTKTCYQCHRTQPLSAFPTHKHTKDGHLNLCRVCKKAADSAAYAKRQATLGKTTRHLPAFPAAPSGHKYCRHCKKLKPHTAFTPTKKYRDGYQSWCRTCVAQRNLAIYHAKDPTTRGVTQWANYHPQEASAARARRKLRPDITNAAHRRWIARYPEKHATHHAVYRALRNWACSRAPPPTRNAAHPASPPRTTTITANPWSCAGSARAATAAPIANACAGCARRGSPKTPKPPKQDRQAQH